MCNNDELITSRQIAAMSIDHVLSNNLLTLSLILTEIIYYMPQVFFFFLSWYPHAITGMWTCSAVYLLWTDQIIGVRVFSILNIVTSCTLLYSSENIKINLHHEMNEASPIFKANGEAPTVSHLRNLSREKGGGIELYYQPCTGY